MFTSVNVFILLKYATYLYFKCYFSLHILKPWYLVDLAV